MALKMFTTSHSTLRLGVLTSILNTIYRCEMHTMTFECGLRTFPVVHVWYFKFLSFTIVLLSLLPNPNTIIVSHYSGKLYHLLVLEFSIVSCYL